jgi:PiT family inorganic phosphate transporter
MFDTPVGNLSLFILGAALLIACAFEFVNGFHDTANAVATVIYTKSLRPWVAVVWSGICNFLGVYAGGIAVAMSIVKLLPTDVLASGGSIALAMVLALLFAAILWNLGTWYLGLPASSSHTLIGAIVGVGLANSLLPGHVFGTGVNWHKVQEIGVSLLVSPIFGLTLAALLLFGAKKLLTNPQLHSPPKGETPPPPLVRALLVGTCSGVSFTHGSNDGQKGVGLIMLILVGILPADFALNTSYEKAHFERTALAAEHLDATVRSAFGGELAQSSAAGDPLGAPEAPQGKVLADLAQIRAAFHDRSSVREIPASDRIEIRNRILRVDGGLSELEKKMRGKMSAEQTESFKKERASLKEAIEYAPSWVLALVAVSLGIGTMIGWKRIVVTVGEKIGKSHMTYAQGASAEVVAAATIGVAAYAGLPVSTTHVLSSGIAGTMLAQKAGLQTSTVRNIALAWVLTLPASTLLALVFFLLFRALLPG